MEGHDENLLLTAATENAFNPKLHLLTTGHSSSSPDKTSHNGPHRAHSSPAICPPTPFTAITRAKPSRVLLAWKTLLS